MKYGWLSLLTLSLIVGFATTGAFAQGTASIDGIVVDQSKAVVTDAQVVLTNVQTGLERSVTSTSEGYFVISDLVPGIYRLRASRSGFKTWVQSDLTLAVGQKLTTYPQLQVGTTTEQVDVTGAPPLVTTASSTLSTVVDSQRIEQLPLNGRNALELLALAPGNIPTARRRLSYGADRTRTREGE